jgi:hypothetical protein
MVSEKVKLDEAKVRVRVSQVIVSAVNVTQEDV